MRSTARTREGVRGRVRVARAAPGAGSCTFDAQKRLLVFRARGRLTCRDAADLERAVAYDDWARDP